MRLYVLMTTAWPTICFLHKRGLARFRYALLVLTARALAVWLGLTERDFVGCSTQKYDMTSLENNYSHLTNSTINKKSPTMHVAKEIGYGARGMMQFHDLLAVAA